MTSITQLTVTYYDHIKDTIRINHTFDNLYLNLNNAISDWDFFLGVWENSLVAEFVEFRIKLFNSKNKNKMFQY
jgi:hypothetical protein